MCVCLFVSGLAHAAMGCFSVKHAVSHGLGSWYEVQVKCTLSFTLLLPFTHTLSVISYRMSLLSVFENALTAPASVDPTPALVATFE